MSVSKPIFLIVVHAIIWGAIKKNTINFQLQLNKFLLKFLILNLHEQFIMLQLQLYHHLIIKSKIL